MLELVNLHSLGDTLRYARSLQCTHGLIIVHNGKRYQIKHELTQTILIKQGWQIVAELKRNKK